MKAFPVLAEANKDGAPQLWKSPEWADSFASFILKLNGVDIDPRVIEIHPPFSGTILTRICQFGWGLSGNGYFSIGVRLKVRPVLARGVTFTGNFWRWR